MQKSSGQSIALLMLLFVVLSLLTACTIELARSPNQVTIDVDNGTRQVETEAKTVRELLAQEQITLGELDRVNPDLLFSVRPNMTVTVIRVTEEVITETATIPFERQVITNESMAPGEERLAQLGSNREEEIVTRLTFENGIEVNRVQISRSIITEPVEEVLIVGIEPQASSVDLRGTVAFISSRNGWIIRNSSNARRRLTTEGDLDGRVFDLSPDGGKLLYTRAVTDVIDSPLNELWTIDTRIVGEEAISLPVKGVLYAEWSPILTDTRIAYSTAERVASQPGWQANNDLWLWDTTEEITDAVEIILANTNGLYPWWGTTFDWSPDGQSFAFANANQVGVVDVLSQTVTILAEFAPFETQGNWVWVPSIAWSPNSKFIATVIHGPPLQDESPEESPVFDVWLLAADGSLQVKADDQVGMWSNPVWHDQGIIYGQATNSLRSIDSRYNLTTMDWDGSNSTVVFPIAEEPGVSLPVQMVWEPNAEQVSFLFINRNDLYLYQGDEIPPQQLTSDQQTQQPKWIIPPDITQFTDESTTTANITPTIVITPFITITATNTATNSTPLTSSTTISP